MPKLSLVTGLDGRRWEIMESDEGNVLHRKEGHTEWHPGLPETVPAHLVPSEKAST